MRGIKAAWAPVQAHLGSLPIDRDGYIVVRPGERTFNPDKHYLWPIPAQQIQYNPELKQNPNWDEEPTGIEAKMAGYRTTCFRPCSLRLGTVLLEVDEVNVWQVSAS